jgi:putative DNA primase/helicase
MSLHQAMESACREIGITPPARIAAGRWVRTNTREKNGKGDASVLIHDDQRGGIVWNWQTGQKLAFRADGAHGVALVRDRAAEEARAKAQAERHAQAAEICAKIVAQCETARHPYLAAKGFPDELGLVCDDPRRHLPATSLGEAIRAALPVGDGPWLIVPGWIGKAIATVQFIGPDGAKKNILGGRMSGAALRIATGRETWVCEGIATAMSIRAALRFLGRRETVLSAFSASNVAQVAASAPQAVIAADNDKPLPQLDGLGTGEFYARRAGCPWVMPQEMGDWNDMHKRDGLRAVALAIKGVRPA